ncbi:MAG: hypothetical protein KTR31_18915 [Myxococcales bacterium]|nr:hypothetical protein [Myxococcales bacterium]
MIWLLLTSAFAQTLGADEILEQGVSLHVGEAGFDVLAESVPALLPIGGFPVPDVEDSGGVGCLGYRYALSDLVVDVALVAVDLRPEAGRLVLDVDLEVSVNDPVDPFTMELGAICLIDSSCDGHVLPFDMNVQAPVTFAVEGPLGKRVLTATVGDLDIQHGLDQDELQVGCGINEIETVLNFFGVSIFDLVVGVVQNTLVGQLDGPLNDALAALSLEQTLEVLGAELEVRVQPESVSVSAIGMELVLSSMFGAETQACVEAFDDGEIPISDGPPPALFDAPRDLQVAGHVSQALMDQALYGVWRTGLLCQNISDDGTFEIPGFAFDTSLLGLLAGEAYGDLFPEDRPIELRTTPRLPPRAEVGGAHDLDLVLEDFGLDFVTEYEGRRMRVLGIALDGPVGLDVPFDAKTGELAVSIDVGADALTTSLASDPLVDDAEALAADMAQPLTALLDTVLGSLLGSSLAFELPSFQGLGVTELGASASGAEQDWLTLDLMVGKAPGGTGKGADCGGCGAGGAGCSSGSAGSLALSGLAALLLLRRRRR